MRLDVLSSWIGVPVPRGGSPSPFDNEIHDDRRLRRSRGMLAPPCAVPVKVEATVPVGAFPTALADIILFAPPVVAADTGPLVSFMHALASPPDGVYGEATEPAGV